MSTAVAELFRRRDLAGTVGGQAAIDRAHAAGFATAPERLQQLLDPGTHVHWGTLFHSDEVARAAETYGDGELCGFGRVGGRWVAYYASDPRVKGASGSPAGMRKAEAFRNFVERAALPLFYLMQGGGARIDHAMSSSFVTFPGTGMGARRYFPRRGALLTGVLGAYYAPWNVAHADFSVMTESSNISLTAPPLVHVGTGQTVTPVELGGAEVQATVTGQIDRVVTDEATALALLRDAFSYLPAHSREPAPTVDIGDPVERSCPQLRDIVPTRMNQAYDVHRVIETVVDAGSFLEYAPRFARNLVAGLARIGGRTVVVIANQPQFMAGVIDVNALVKMRRALRLCADLRLPLLSLVDVPGVLPTKDQEQRRIMSLLYDHGTERLQLTVPKVVVVLRKGVGFGLMAMSAGDPEGVTFAWPTAQICFTGLEACVRVVHRRELEQAADPDGLMRELVARYDGLAAPWQAAGLGYLDDVIDPAETRTRVARALEVTAWQ